MNDKNFDSFRNLKAPQKWIENAINIPKTSNKKAPVFFVKYSRQLATVACLVLVCTLSLAFYFMHDNTAPIAKNPMPTQTKEHTVQNDNQTQNTTHNSNNDKNSNNDNNNSFNIIVPVPDDTKNDNKPEKPTKPQSPSKPNNPQDPSLENPTDPVENPTQAPTQPTQKPTEKPTERPTNPPTQEPTELRPQKPHKPTEPPTEEPTVPTDDDPPASPPPASPPSNPGEGSSGADCTFYTCFPSSLLDSSNIVFCSVVDPDGKYVIQRAQANIDNIYAGAVYVSYNLPSYAFTKSGRYVCNFYSADHTYICSCIEYFRN